MSGGNNDLSADYAGPGVRWSLLIHDYPGADYTWKLVPGTDLGIPAAWGGDEEFCVVTITFPAHTGKAPVQGWKAASEELNVERWTGPQGNRTKTKVSLPRTPELLQVLITKTLGRACKKAGYPDDLVELKGLMHWRQRTAEVEAITGGRAVAAIGPGRVDDDKALNQLARPGSRPDDDVAVDADEVTPAAAPTAAVPPPTAAAPAAGGDGPPSQAQVQVLREVISSLKGPEQAELRKKAKELGCSLSSPTTAAQAQELIDFGESLDWTPKEQPGHVQPAPVGGATRPFGEALAEATTAPEPDAAELAAVGALTSYDDAATAPFGD